MKTDWNKIIILSISNLWLLGCGSVSSQSSILKNLDASKLSGTWAKILVSNAETSALGFSSKAKITRVNLLQMDRQGEELAVQEKTCLLKAESTGRSSLNFPASFASSIPDSSYRYQLKSDSTSLSLSLDKAVEILGARLVNPLEDSLPVSDQDPRLFDQDADTKPGMTVDVSLKALVTIKGAVYIAQRQVWSEQISFESETSARGSYVWTQEQEIVGASNSIFSSVKPQVVPLIDESSITLRRLPDGANCQEAAEQIP